MNIWIALDEVTPDMGSMRFYSGSHRLGPLGRVWPEGKKLLDVYPDIPKELTLSPELYLMPGDATMHHSLCIHGAPANSTDRPRWAYILQLFPADAVFTETVLPFVARLGLQTDKPFDYPRFPQVYP